VLTPNYSNHCSDVTDVNLAALPWQDVEVEQMLGVFIHLLAAQMVVSQVHDQLTAEVSSAYAKLEPQTIRAAEGHFRHDYLIPAGFYKDMWDWDGFFIGSHLAHQSREKAQYLKWWVLNFTGVSAAINKDGWVPGVLAPNRITGTKAVSDTRDVYNKAISGAGRSHRFGETRRLSVGRRGMGHLAPHHLLSRKDTI
jgi:hypothetical protein